MTVALRMGYTFDSSEHVPNMFWFNKKKENITILFIEQEGKYKFSKTNKEKEILDMIEIVYNELWNEYCGSESESESESENPETF